MGQHDVPDRTASLETLPAAEVCRVLGSGPDGLSTREALLSAGPVRLRPIIMTTLSMILGMVPLAAGFGAGSELRQPMGVSVIGGLIVSTLLTLVLVPVAYSLLDDLRNTVRARWRSATRGGIEVADQRAVREGG